MSLKMVAIVTGASIPIYYKAQFSREMPRFLFQLNNNSTTITEREVELLKHEPFVNQRATGKAY
jgi:mannose/fructose-specific phosphotransferase system component IIA